MRQRISYDSKKKTRENLLAFLFKNYRQAYRWGLGSCRVGQSFGNEESWRPGYCCSNSSTRFSSSSSSSSSLQNPSCVYVCVFFSSPLSSWLFLWVVLFPFLAWPTILPELPANTWYIFLNRSACASREDRKIRTTQSWWEWKEGLSKKERCFSNIGINLECSISNMVTANSPSSLSLSLSLWHWFLLDQQENPGRPCYCCCCCIRFNLLSSQVTLHSF